MRRGYVLPEQVLRHLDGIDNYTIGTHEKNPHNAAVPIADHSSVFDGVDFDIYTLANLAPITGAGSEQFARLFDGLSLHAPFWLRNDGRRGILPNWQIGEGGHSLRRAIQRRYAPAIRFSRLAHDETISRQGPLMGELDGEINCKRGCERD